MACGSTILDSERSIEKIKSSGKLIVLTRNAPTTYYFDSNEQATGPEYELAEAFAKNLGVETEYRVFNTVHEILEALKNGQGDIAAAGLSKTKVRYSRFLFGPVYQQVQQQVVCRNGMKHSGEISDLVGLKLVVPKNSSYEEYIDQFKKILPDLAWEASDELNSEQLFEKIWRAEIDCTFADSNIASINRRYFPELIVASEQKEVQSLAWVLRPGSNDLQEAIEVWFKQFKSAGELNQVMERYYGFIKKFDFVIVSVISPLLITRKKAKKIFGSRYFEIYVKCGIKELIKRDTKGLYKKAKDKVITNLIGYNSKIKYEKSKYKKIVVNTDKLNLLTCKKLIVKKILN